MNARSRKSTSDRRLRRALGFRVDSVSRHRSPAISANKPARAYRCTPSQGRCRGVDAGCVARFGRFKNSAWLGADADGSRTVVSDNAAHRVSGSRTPTGTARRTSGSATA